MYVLGAFPPIISILMFAPVIIAPHIDKKNIDHPIASNINQLAIGFFVGCIIYLGIGGYLQAYGNRDIWNWDEDLIMYEIILPILLGGGFLYRKVRGQIRLFKFERGGIGASLLFLLTVAPFLIGLSVLLTSIGLSVFLTIFSFFPALFGVWFLLNMSNYTRRYYIAFILLSLLSWFLSLFIAIGLIQSIRLRS